MGITPISGIRPLQVVKTPPVDSDISKVFDIENSSRPGDDSYSGNGKKSPGGQDDDPEAPEESMEAESMKAERTEAESKEVAGPTSSSDDEPTAQINYFA